MLQDKLDLGALIGTGVAELAMRIVAALLILVIGLWLAKLIVKLVKKNRAIQKLAPEVQTFFASAMKVLLYALVIMMAVTTVGVPTASILAVLGSCGLAVGLALQGSLSNLAGGIMLMIFRPFKVGDFISDGAHDGTVKKITMFYTVIATADNLQITLPNGALANAAIKNLNANDIRRLDIDVTMSPAADKEKANTLVLQDPAPEALVTVTEGGLPTFKLRTWFNSGDYWTVYFGLNEAVQKTLTANELPLAHQQVDLHTDK